MRGLGYRLTDGLVIAACSLTFVAVVSPGRHEPKGPPIGLIAQDLGTTPEHFQELAAALYVSVEQLDTVMEKYRPVRLYQR